MRMRRARDARGSADAYCIIAVYKTSATCTMLLHLSPIAHHAQRKESCAQNVDRNQGRRAACDRPDPECVCELSRRKGDLSGAQDRARLTCAVDEGSRADG
jgi:hypothetical protein